MRKDSGIEVMDHIKVYQSGNDRIKDILLRNEDTIKREVLATDIITDSMDGISKEWTINGEACVLGVCKQ